ncbi:hypothetical protein NXX77_18660 [Phocaeicola dorei]|nr:hypothetical protein [Phocaeicola dorei]
MRKAGISPASLGQEDWKAVFNGGIILPGGRKLMAVREPSRIRDEDIRCVTGECKRVGNGNVKQDTEK